MFSVGLLTYMGGYATFVALSTLISWIIVLKRYRNKVGLLLLALILSTLFLIYMAPPVKWTCKISDYCMFPSKWMGQKTHRRCS